MSRCIHVFIVWNTAQSHKTAILERISGSFNIVKQLEIHWSREHFPENLTSFYEEDFRHDPFQLQQRGTGPLLAIVVEDMAPVFHQQRSRRGLETVNTNVLKVKQSVRDSLTKTFNFHASINEAETRNNIVKLTGKRLEDFLSTTTLDGNVEVIERDCPGVHGWSSLAELFNVLNECNPYVVLRGFEALPHKHRMEKEGDIDILVADMPAFLNVLRPGRDFGSNAFRFFNWMDIGDQHILIHAKFVGDNYYDRALQQRLLDTRLQNNKGIFVPQNDLYFWTLLYHGLFHKENWEKYIPTLPRIAAEIGVHWRYDKEYLCHLLSDWMLLNRYECRLHLDGGACQLQPQNFRYGLENKTALPRIFCVIQHFNTSVITVTYVSEGLLRKNETLFTSLIRPKDSLCALDNHTIDPRVDLYREFVGRQAEKGELMWRYAIRVGHISEMVYSSTEVVSEKLSKSFLGGQEKVAGPTLCYHSEVTASLFKDPSAVEYLASTQVYSGAEGGYAAVVDFLKQSIKQFGQGPEMMSPFSWDLLPKNACRTSEGIYQFFDFEAEYKESLSLSYYLFIVALHVGETWAYSLEERYALYYRLCTDFDVSPGDGEALRIRYEGEVKEAVDPATLLDNPNYLRYFKPPIFHDGVQYLSASACNQWQAAQERRYVHYEETIAHVNATLDLTNATLAHTNAALAHTNATSERALEELHAAYVRDTNHLLHKAESERLALMRSPSFRIGRALTWLPRSLSRVLRGR